MNGRETLRGRGHTHNPSQQWADLETRAKERWVLGG